MRFVLFATLLFCSACTPVTDNAHPPAARLIPVAQDAFSGSSVNVLSGVKQTLYTRNGIQYAAFYNAKAKLVVAKRALNSDQWQVVETSFSGNVNDAHNHISLVVEDEDYVHIAWDHHNTPLKYARSVAPGSLQLAKAHFARIVAVKVAEDLRQHRARPAKLELVFEGQLELVEGDEIAAVIVHLTKDFG